MVIDNIDSDSRLNYFIIDRDCTAPVQTRSSNLASSSYYSCRYEHGLNAFHGGGSEYRRLPSDGWGGGSPESEFWAAAAISACAGFLIPLPYNYMRIRRYGKGCH